MDKCFIYRWPKSAAATFGEVFIIRINKNRSLLALSINSIDIPWVNNEIEAAFEKEALPGQVVLFPFFTNGQFMTDELGLVKGVLGPLQ